MAESGMSFDSLFLSCSSVGQIRNIDGKLSDLLRMMDSAERGLVNYDEYKLQTVPSVPTPNNLSVSVVKHENSLILLPLKSHLLRVYVKSSFTRFSYPISNYLKSSRIPFTPLEETESNANGTRYSC